MLRQFFIAVAVVIGASCVGLTVNYFRAAPLPLVQDWKKTIEEKERKQSSGKLEILDLETMTSIYDKENVVVFDARPEEFYMFERIPGARSLPLDNAETLIPGILKEIKEDVLIITYCDGVTCPSARKLGLEILKAGHGNVSVFLGGLEEWTNNGMPTDGE